MEMDSIIHFGSLFLRSISDNEGLHLKTLLFLDMYKIQTVQNHPWGDLISHPCF